MPKLRKIHVAVKRLFIGLYGAEATWFREEAARRGIKPHTLILSILREWKHVQEFIQDKTKNQ